jgi:hypothetical protein
MHFWLKFQKIDSKCFHLQIYIWVHFLISLSSSTIAMIYCHSLTVFIVWIFNVLYCLQLAWGKNALKYIVTNLEQWQNKCKQCTVHV